MLRLTKAAAICLMMLFLVLGLAGCSDGKASAPQYTIAKVEDMSMGPTVRTQYRVVVPGDASESVLRAVAEGVIAKAKEEKPFNAVSIGFYGPGDDVGSAYTLGYADYAPSGDWAAACSARTGNYGAMKLKLNVY